MSKKQQQQSPSPLAEDAAPLEIPEAEEIRGVVEVHAVEGDEAPEIPLVTVPQAERERPIPVDLKADASQPHVLDRASVGSKIVVVRVEGGTQARFADPNVDIVTLPKSDPASKLPVGARIFKASESTYVATQMDPAVDHDPLITETAGAAIAGFLAHFHPQGG